MLSEVHKCKMYDLGIWPPPHPFATNFVYETSIKFLHGPLVINILISFVELSGRLWRCFLYNLFMVYKKFNFFLDH